MVKAVQRGRLSVAGSSMVGKMGVEFFFQLILMIIIKFIFETLNEIVYKTIISMRCAHKIK